MSRIIPNAFQTPNFFIDVLMKYISPSEYKVLSVIARKTFGWGKDKDFIAVSQIVKLTGMSENNVRQSLSVLKDLGIIIQTASNDPQLNYGNEYMIETDTSKYRIKDIVGEDKEGALEFIDRGVYPNDGGGSTQNLGGGSTQNLRGQKTLSKNNYQLSDKDKKDSDSKVLAIISASDKSKTKGYTMLPEQYIPYAESFSQMTGINYIKKYASDWMATINDWINLGYSTEDVRNAIASIQDEGKAGMISRPGSIDWKLRANQSAKSAQPKTYLSGWKDFDKDE